MLQRNMIACYEKDSYRDKTGKIVLRTETVSPYITLARIRTSHMTHTLVIISRYIIDFT